MNTYFDASAFDNCYIVDFALDINDTMTPIILRALASHPDYYGNGVDEPHIIIKHIPLRNILTMGANKDSMRITANGIDFVHFKDADFVDKISMNRTDLLTVYGRANLNTFNGTTSIQCFIDDYEFEAEDKYAF